MKITKKWLLKKAACVDAVNLFEKQKEKDSSKILEILIKKKQYNWANWVIVQLMKYKQYLSYSIYSAEQVIDIFEKKHPNDKKPREAITAAKKCLINPSKKNKKIAYTAATAAYVAEEASAYAAAVAYVAATYAYDAVANTYAANAYVYVIAYAASYAANVKNKIRIKILKYGIKLLKDKE